MRWTRLRRQRASTRLPEWLVTLDSICLHFFTHTLGKKRPKCALRIMSFRVPVCNMFRCPSERNRDSGHGVSMLRNHAILTDLETENFMIHLFLNRAEIVSAL